MADSINRSGAEDLVEDVRQPRTLNIMAKLKDDAPATLNFQRVMLVDVELQIRHWSTLKLRGVRWLVTDQVMGNPLLGRIVLEALGLNTRDILDAAAQRYPGEVDMCALIKPQPDTNGRVAGLLDGVYYSDGSLDEANHEEDDGWLGMGPEDEQQKAEKLLAKCDDASRNGISVEGKRTIQYL